MLCLVHATDDSPDQKAEFRHYPVSGVQNLLVKPLVLVRAAISITMGRRDDIADVGDAQGFHPPVPCDNHLGHCGHSDSIRSNEPKEVDISRCFESRAGGHDVRPLPKPEARFLRHQQRQVST